MEKVNVDHIEPINTLKDGFIDWNTFIDRMFCEEENLNVMCRTCHKAKTKEETQLRKKYRQEKKK